MRTKVISIFTLLLMAVTGAWAQTPIKSTGIVRSMTATTKEAVKRHSGDVRVAVGVINSKAAPMRLAGPRRAPKEGYALVTLTAGDVWEDGSGYQMLLDADATAYGSIIPETGALTSEYSDASAETYAEFEYKIPENADGNRSTSNIVFNSSVSIEIPAGTYDWCITNPSPDDRVWIASENGNVGGRQNDFVFEAGGTYVFTVSLNGDNDQVNLETIFPWTPTLPTELTATPAATSAEVSWTPGENNDAWNLRYREYVEIAPGECNRFIDLPVDGYQQQIEDIIVYDNDGDGNNWGYTYSSDAQDDVCFYSASYLNYQALTPDNWLVFPTKLGGTFKFKVKSRSASYPDTFGVFVLEGDNFESVDGFVQLGEDKTFADEDWHEVEFDLSAYSGFGYVAIRHYNSYDRWAIYVDDVEITVPDAKEYAEWIEVEGVTNPYTIEGLTPATEYEVQVMGYNDQSSVRAATDWTESVLFTTTVGGLGDVNLDGYVTIADVTALVNIILGKDDVEPYKYSHTAADTNRDTAISIADVTALVNYILKGEWPELTYTVVGPEAVFGSDWDEASEANNMVKGADGVYTWKKEGVTLSGESFEFKVVGNHHSSVYQWPADANYVANITEGDGVYDIVITFNPDAAGADRISCTLTKLHGYCVVGTPYNLFGSDWDDFGPSHTESLMTRGDDGLYRWTNDRMDPYLNEGQDVYFQVIEDYDLSRAWPDAYQNGESNPKGRWFHAWQNGAYRFEITFNPETKEVELKFDLMQ